MPTARGLTVTKAESRGAREPNPGPPGAVGTFLPGPSLRCLFNQGLNSDFQERLPGAPAEPRHASEASEAGERRLLGRAEGAFRHRSGSSVLPLLPEGQPGARRFPPAPLRASGTGSLL